MAVKFNCLLPLKLTCSCRYMRSPIKLNNSKVPVPSNLPNLIVTRSPSLTMLGFRLLIADIPVVLFTYTVATAVSLHIPFVALKVTL
jgi:hypothetical protein